ncbi:MAG: hypothetical protein WC955_08415 [Elusimicrobiota bacterium]
MFNHKLLFTGVFALLVFPAYLTAGSLLEEFKDSFTITDTKKKKNVTTESKLVVTESKLKKVYSDYQSDTQQVYVYQGEVQPLIVVAQAETEDSKLKKFYGDFNSSSSNDSDSTPSNSTTQRSYSRHHPRRYSPDFYWYNYPYYYPYPYFYPGGGTVYMYENVQGRVQDTMQNSSIMADELPVPERHMWYNAGLNYQYIGENINAVGLGINLVSSGKSDELSYGFKFNYNLFSEKVEAEHFTLSLYDIGITVGKPMGCGLIESYIAYCNLSGLSGLALNLSVDQWFFKYFSVKAALGVYVINQAPLTDLYAGFGVGNSMIQLQFGYRARSSLTTQLNGPELRMVTTF